MDDTARQAPASGTPAAQRLLGLVGDASPLTRLAVITVLIFVVMSLLRPDPFFTMGNFSSMAFQIPEFALLSLAIMVAMLTGGIDLSIVGVANLSSILAVLVMRHLAPEVAGEAGTIGVIALGIAVALLCGGLCGLLNGLCVSYLNIPPILATLGTGLIFTGIATVLTGGAAMMGFPAEYSVIGNGTLLYVPIPMWIFAGLAALVALILSRTAFGLKVYMMGTNPLASRFAGISNAGINLRIYTICGTLAAVAGLIIASRANSAKADYGEAYLLLSVLVAVLGGTNPYGGVGRVGGIVLAVLSMQFLSSGFNMMQVSNFAKEFIWGTLLLVVMVVNLLHFRSAPAAAARPQGNSQPPPQGQPAPSLEKT
ncbi:MAG: ABC transporter permease [Rhodospirillaceae bacterium]|nr:ABC transporter permease [Rhodospirillaceae bacterium]